MTETGGNNMKVSEYITQTWRTLEHSLPQDTDSHIGLPHPYIVPGGKFNEQFYWDSYFIMLGLATERKWDLIEGMIQNHIFLLKKFGFIPTANYEHFLTRSQPPFLSHMVKLLARHKGKKVLAEYLGALLLEYRFWMKGHQNLQDTEHLARERVVQTSSGAFMNRYYDEKAVPRIESEKRDTQTAHRYKDRQSDRLFLHLRSAAESGWDFSSRWLLDVTDIGTIHTADIIPVDLNCLLYHLEITIAESYRLTHQDKLAHRFQKAADRRARVINTYCWNELDGFYYDFNFHLAKRTTVATLAGVFPLYVRIASSQQAKKVADRLSRDFLKDGGVVTSLVETGEQWDAPNGWAPLQWITIKGLRNYGHYQLAHEIKTRWIKTNVGLFHEKGKLFEKYNVVYPRKLASGGEYPLQEGFGWTNGVLATLLAE